MPPISVMIKPASGLCNMMCDYCFYSDEAKKENMRNIWLYDRTDVKKCYKKNNTKC